MARQSELHSLNGQLGGWGGGKGKAECCTEVERERILRHVLGFLLPEARSPQDVAVCVLWSQRGVFLDQVVCSFVLICPP